MSALWAKVRPHLLSWHMVPCLVMLVAAVGAATATGQPGRVLGAIGCVVMMMVMMAAMGGHGHGSGHEGRQELRRRWLRRNPRARIQAGGIVRRVHPRKDRP